MIVNDVNGGKYMACYDCEDCRYHEYNGGNCDRWEYDCPYNVFKRIDDVNLDIKQIAPIFKKIGELNDQLDDYVFNEFKFCLRDLIESNFNIEDYDKYKNLKSKDNKD